MQLSDLQTNIDYRRRDTTTTFIGEAEKIAYLNEALRIINAENDWEWTKTSASFTYTDGSCQYALSSVASDNKFPVDIFYSDNYQFEMVSPEDFRKLSGAAYNIFAIDNNNLLVKTSFGTGSLQYHYYSTYGAKTSGGSWQASLSATTDEPLMPERWHDILVDFAAARCYQKEGLNEDYQIAYTDFLRKLNKIKREYPSKRQKSLKRMTHIDEWSARGTILDTKENPLRQ